MWSLNVTVHIDIPLPVTDWLCITFVSETWLNKWFQCIGAEWTTQKHVPHSDPMMVCIRMATQQPFLKQQRKWRLLPSHNALHDKLPHTHTHTRAQHAQQMHSSLPHFHQRLALRPHGQMRCGVEPSGEHYGDMFMVALSSGEHDQEWWHR